MEGFLEGPVIVSCSLDMLIMWHSTYDSGRYIYVMLNLFLFTIDTLKLIDDFYYVCYRTDCR